MDLELDVIRSRGRAAVPVQAEIVRPLTAADLALLDTEKGTKAPALKKLRDAHHRIARLIAEGELANNEISVVTGYSESRISILKADPAFSELVAFYASKVEEARSEAFADAQAKLAAVNMDALEELHERLMDTPETINHDQLLDIVKVTSDRTGNGPQSKSTNVNLNVDLAGRIAAGRARVSRLVEGSVAPKPAGAGEPQLPAPAEKKDAAA